MTDSSAVAWLHRTMLVLRGELEEREETIRRLRRKGRRRRTGLGIERESRGGSGGGRETVGGLSGGYRESLGGLSNSGGYRESRGVSGGGRETQGGLSGGGREPQGGLCLFTLEDGEDLDHQEKFLQLQDTLCPWSEVSIRGHIVKS